MGPMKVLCLCCLHPSHADYPLILQGKRAHALYLQLVGWPQLLRPDGTRTITSSHFRVPIAIGRFKEKKDILYDIFRSHSQDLCGPHHRTVRSDLHGLLLIEHIHMDDYKSKASKINKKHTASNYPCADCVRHKKDLPLRAYHPEDAAKLAECGRPTFMRHMELEGCAHDFDAAEVTCGCIIPAARHDTIPFDLI